MSAIVSVPPHLQPFLLHGAIRDYMSGLFLFNFKSSRWYTAELGLFISQWTPNGGRFSDNRFFFVKLKNEWFRQFMDNVYQWRLFTMIWRKHAVAKVETIAVHMMVIRRIWYITNHHDGIVSFFIGKLFPKQSKMEVLIPKRSTWKLSSFHQHFVAFAQNNPKCNSILSKNGISNESIFWKHISSY